MESSICLPSVNMYSIRFLCAKRESDSIFLVAKCARFDCKNKRRVVYRCVQAVFVGARMREPRVVHTANRDVTRRPINTFVVVGLSSYVCRDYAWRTVQSRTPTKSDVNCGFCSINFAILHHVDFYIKQIFLVIIVTSCLNLPNVLRTYCYQSRR